MPKMSLLRTFSVPGTSPSNSRSSTVMNGETKRHYSCGVCKRSVIFTDAFKCKDCRVDIICFNCVSSHIAQEHKVVETSGYPPSICVEHKFVETLYCTTDRKTFCLLCQSQHTEHQLGSIRSKVAESRSIIGRMMSDTNELAEFLGRETRKSSRVLEQCKQDVYIFHEQNTHESVIEVIRVPLRDLWNEYDRVMDESKGVFQTHHELVMGRKATVSGILTELKDILPHDDAKIINLTQEKQPELEKKIAAETETNRQRFLCSQLVQHRELTLQEKQEKIKEVLELCFPTIHLPELLYTECQEPKSLTKLNPPVESLENKTDYLIVPAHSGFFIVDFDISSKDERTMTVVVYDIRRNNPSIRVSEPKKFSIKTSKKLFVCPSSTAKSRMYVLDEQNSACYIEGHGKNGENFILERQNFASSYKFKDTYLPGHAIFYRHSENERFYTMIDFTSTPDSKSISWLVNQTKTVSLKCSELPPLHFNTFAAERYTSRLAFVESSFNIRVVHMKSEDAEIERDFSIPTTHLGLSTVDAVAFFDEDKLAALDRNKKEVTLLEFVKVQGDKHELCGWKAKGILSLSSYLDLDEEIEEVFNTGTTNGSILILLKSGQIWKLDWQNEI